MTTNNKEISFTYKIKYSDSNLNNLFTHINRHLTTHQSHTTNYPHTHHPHKNKHQPKSEFRPIPLTTSQYLHKFIDPPRPPNQNQLTSECSICLLPYGAHHLIYYLPKCQHNFHQTCLATWFESLNFSHLECPLCRCEHYPINN